MLPATIKATSGSSGCQPVRATAPMPTSTPAEVQTSVRRWWASASSVIDLVPLARAQQDQTDAKVHQRGGDGDQQAEAEVLEGPRTEESMHRGAADDAGGHEDQRAFDDA